MNFKQEVLNKSEDLKVCYYRYIDVLKLKDSEGSFNLFIKDIIIIWLRKYYSNSSINVKHFYWELSDKVIVVSNSYSKIGLVLKFHIGNSTTEIVIKELNKTLDEFKG